MGLLVDSGRGTPRKISHPQSSPETGGDAARTPSTCRLPLPGGEMGRRLLLAAHSSESPLSVPTSLPLLVTSSHFPLPPLWVPLSLAYCYSPVFSPFLSWGRPSTLIFSGAPFKPARAGGANGFPVSGALVPFLARLPGGAAFISQWNLISCTKLLAGLAGLARSRFKLVNSSFVVVVVAPGPFSSTWDAEQKKTKNKTLLLKTVKQKKNIAGGML